MGWEEASILAKLRSPPTQPDKVANLPIDRFDGLHGFESTI
ncbi:hypothetical protein [Sphingopyxis fribergensis]|nr:hypothetical protein [Sphingopyxis fribergensis]